MKQTSAGLKVKQFLQLQNAKMLGLRCHLVQCKSHWQGDYVTKLTIEGEKKWWQVWMVTSFLKSILPPPTISLRRITEDWDVSAWDVNKRENVTEVYTLLHDTGKAESEATVTTFSGRDRKQVRKLGWSRVRTNKRQHLGSVCYSLAPRSLCSEKSS